MTVPLKKEMTYVIRFGILIRKRTTEMEGICTFSYTQPSLLLQHTHTISMLTPASLSQPLDRDPPHGRAQWRLRVTATDGELEAHTDVRVNLKDANDNEPFFPSRTVTASVPENIPIGNYLRINLHDSKPNSA